MTYTWWLGTYQGERTQQQMRSHVITSCFLQMLPTGQIDTVVTTAGPQGAAASPVPRLALPNLEKAVSGYLTHALAPSTRRTYQSGHRRFLRFGADAGFQPLPLSEDLLLFVAHLASQGLAPQTVKAYLSATRYFHITAGHGDPVAPGALPVCNMWRGA